MKILFIDSTKNKNIDINNGVKDIMEVLEDYKHCIDYYIIPGEEPKFSSDFCSSDFLLNQNDDTITTKSYFLSSDFILKQLKKVQKEYISSIVCFIIDPVKNVKNINLVMKLFKSYGIVPVVVINDRNINHYIRHELVHAIIEILDRNTSSKLKDTQDEQLRKENLYGVICNRAKEIELENLKRNKKYFNLLPIENKVWKLMFSLNTLLISLLKKLIDLLLHNKNKKHTKEEVIDILVQAHATFEGFYVEGSLPNILNNPGCLIYVGQKNAIKHDSGFCQFKTVNQGWKALRHQIELNLSGKSSLYNLEMDLYDYINVYASTSPEHERINYACFIADKLGVSPDTKLENLWKNYE